MTTNIPTFQELNRRAVLELHAMFRDAASISTNPECSAAEKAAAARTLENIRRCLVVRDIRP